MLGYHKAQLERDASRLRRKRGEQAYIKPGRYYLAILRQAWRCHSQAGAILKALQALHELAPEKTIELSRRIKVNRRYVASDSASLYLGSSRLKSHGREFAPGWFADTNLSYPNTTSYLADVFSFYGLMRGSEWYFGKLR